MKSNRIAFLAAPAQKDVSLYQSSIQPTAGGVAVDFKTGVISGVAILTAGLATPANMEAFRVDQTSLQQVCDLINADTNGARCRVTHPELAQGVFDGLHDDILCLVGRVKNARIDGNVLRGDVHLGTYAHSCPQGNMWDFLLTLADKDPAAIGMSCRLGISDLLDAGDGQAPLARFDSCRAVDFVGRPGGNRNGLLSAQGTAGGTVPPGRPHHKEDAMDKLKKYLEPLGLKSGASDEEALRFLASLTGDARAKGEALLSAEDKPKFEALLAKPPEKPAAPVTPTAQPVASISQEEIDKRVQAALAAEEDRKTKVAALCQEAQLSAEQTAEIAAMKPSVDGAKKLVELAKKWAPQRVAVGQDRNTATLSEGMSDAILLRVNRVKVEKPHERAREFRGMSLLRMGESWLHAYGFDTAGLSRMELATLLFSRQQLAQRLGTAALTMGTGDFPGILANSLRKTLRQAYDVTPATWSRWAREATVPDFKEVSRVQLSNAPALLLKREGAEYKYGTLGEEKATYTIATYGRGLKLTREMIVNDDLSAFDRIVPSMGAMARYLEDDIVYAVLTANANMADGGALFNSTAVTTAGGHANLAGSSAALSVTSLGAARAAMRKQKGILVTDPDTGTASAAILNLAMRHLLVPAAIETVAEQLIGSIVDPAKNNATPNPFANKLQITAEPRLDANSVTAWYCTADTAVVDTVEVAFLEGERAPVLEQEDDFDTDARKYKVRHNVAAAAIDFRGMYKNAGA